MAIFIFISIVILAYALVTLFISTIFIIHFVSYTSYLNKKYDLNLTIEDVMYNGKEIREELKHDQ